MRQAILLTLLFVAATGYCTGVYVEVGPNHQPGLIQAGDVFEYYCELPSNVTTNKQVLLSITYPNAELFQALFTPHVLREGEVLFP